MPIWKYLHIPAMFSSVTLLVGGDILFHAVRRTGDLPALRRFLAAVDPIFRAGVGMLSLGVGGALGRDHRSDGREAPHLKVRDVTTPVIRATRRHGPRVVHVDGLAPAEYRFVNRWRVPGTLDEVSDVIQHPDEFRRWWPAAWLDYELVEPGDQDGVGRVFRYRVKGWLPYSLNLTFRVTERQPPHSFAVEASGDLVGNGRWTLEQDGDRVDVTYDWRVRAERPLIRRLSPFVKPIFRSNHFWVMRQGAYSMMYELLRRRATTDEARSRVPAAPRPIPPTRWPWTRGRG